MNPSKLLTRLKMRLGIYTTPLPFDNPDEALMDVVIAETIPSYSQLLPHKVERTIDFSTAKVIERRGHEVDYEIPKELMDRPILAISYMDPLSTTYAPDQFCNDGIYGYGSGIYGDMMQAKANADIMGLVTPMTSIVLLRPNRLRVGNLHALAARARLEICYEHSENLSTITPNLEDSFFELALCDVANFLYQNLRGYSTIETSLGSIQLPLDEWRTFADRRETLLDSWWSTYHYDFAPYYIQ